MVNFDQNGVFLTPTLKISVLGAKGASRTILGSFSQKRKLHNSTKGGALWVGTGSNLGGRGLEQLIDQQYMAWQSCLKLNFLICKKYFHFCLTKLGFLGLSKATYLKLFP